VIYYGNVKKEFRKEKWLAVRLNVSAAFHSSFLKPMKEEFRDVLNKLSFEKPQKKVIRNYDVKIYEGKEDIIEGLTEQINHPVLFKKTVELCLADNIKKFIDVFLRFRWGRDVILCYLGRRRRNDYYNVETKFERN